MIDRLRDEHLKITTAESCTGGLLAALLTSVAGASAVFDRGVVTYADTQKTALLGVDLGLLRDCGAVSVGVARAMAEGALTSARADVALAITGIAGPTGGSAEKPVGLVYIAVSRAGADTRVAEHRFGDQSRHAIRMASVAAALDMLEDALR